MTTKTQTGRDIGREGIGGDAEIVSVYTRAQAIEAVLEFIDRAEPDRQARLLTQLDTLARQDTRAIVDETAHYRSEG